MQIIPDYEIENQEHTIAVQEVISNSTYKALLSTNIKLKIPHHRVAEIKKIGLSLMHLH